MKSFLKYLLATIVGVLVSGVLALLIFIGIVSALVSQSEKAVYVEENSVLLLRLDQIITDRSSNNPLEGFDFLTMQPTPQIGLNDILKAIDNASRDPKILGIYMENSVINAGAATIEEIRNALIAFRDSGKFIVSHADYYPQKTYYLSSVADKVFLNPQGIVEWVGLRSEVMFFKNALEKLGIEPQLIRHGKFKSAGEPFVLDKLSPENRQQIATYMGSIWDQWVMGVSEQREIPKDELNRIANAMSVWNAQTSLQHGLVDSLVYKDQVIDMLKERTGTDPSKDLAAVTVAQYAKVPAPRKGKGLARNKVAVVYASGEILMGDNSTGSIASESFARTIREARRDSSIKAIVLRINSPGGSALASEVIWREVDLARQAKPVVVSMGDLAASGGYYIAAPADAIVANPTTITGSIGVFGLLFNVKEGMNSKLGLTVDVVNTNTYSDFGSPFRPLGAEERNIFQRMVSEIYTTFVGHVAQGRGMTPEDVDSIGQGRVWTGNNAIELGLVDEIGGLNRAIELAAQKANLDHYRITELPKIDNPVEALMKSLTGAAMSRIFGNELSSGVVHYQRLQSIINNQGNLARLPYDVEVY